MSHPPSSRTLGRFSAGGRGCRDPARAPQLVRALGRRLSACARLPEAVTAETGWSSARRVRHDGQRQRGGAQRGRPRQHDLSELDRRQERRVRERPERRRGSRSVRRPSSSTAAPTLPRARCSSAHRARGRPRVIDRSFSRRRSPPAMCTSPAPGSLRRRRPRSYRASRGRSRRRVSGAPFRLRVRPSTPSERSPWGGRAAGR